MYSRLEMEEAFPASPDKKKPTDLRLRTRFLLAPVAMVIPPHQYRCHLEHLQSCHYQDSFGEPCYYRSFLEKAVVSMTLAIVSERLLFFRGYSSSDSELQAAQADTSRQKRPGHYSAREDSLYPYH